MLDRHVQHWGQEESFPCPFGLFQLKGMPFGINNVPSTLRKVMDVTMGDLRGWICIFCLDDNTDTIFFFSLQAILDINEVCQTHFQTQTLPNVIPGPLVTLLMEKKMWTKLSVKNTNLEVLSWWEKWISRFRQILETSVLNVFVHLFRDFGISRRSAFLLFLFFPIH